MPAENAFRLEPTDSKVWKLIFDLPGEKVNKFTRAVMDEFSNSLLPQIEALIKDKKIEALVVFSGKPGQFIAGADIEMIRATRTAKEAQELSQMGQKVLNRWEDLAVPTVVAIEGPAMGGGCELSLASSAILMSSDPAARIALPEVMLGILPGTGGCVRLPRKVGLVTALDLILTGKALNADRAFKAGMIEAVIPKESFEASTLQWVTKNLKALQSGVRIAKVPKLAGMGGPVGTLMEKTPLGRRVILKKAREGVLSKTRGQYPAPMEILDVLQAIGASYGPKLSGRERDFAMEREAVGFGKLAETDISKNLIRLFFLTEAVKKNKGVEGAKGAERPVMTAAVLGAGVMGGGIAQLLASKNLPTRMKDLNLQALALGIQAATKIFKKQVQRKKITSREMLQKLNCIAPTTDYTGFSSADLVIEAVVENMDIKKKVFAELEQAISERTVVVSNTSSLSISEMQTAFKKPERFAGMHFFNPVSKMPLIEVIRGAQTSDETVVSVYQFCKKLGKTPIVVKDAPGFLVNRLLMPYLNEATWMLSEGVPVEELDQAMLEFGMPMGPMELIDEVGIDVGEKVSKILFQAFGDRMASAPTNSKFVAASRLGKKSGVGIYRYQDKDKFVDAKIYELIGVTPTPRRVSAQEIVERCVLSMINEASRCLDEKIVDSADTVDLGMIMGTGFPPFRGGLLRYADSLGTKTVLEKMTRYEKRFGARFTPAPALLKMNEQGRRFYSGL